VLAQEPPGLDGQRLDVVVTFDGAHAVLFGLAAFVFVEDLYCRDGFRIDVE